MRRDGSNEFRTWRVRCVVVDRPRDFPEGTAATRSGTERAELDEHAEPVFDVTGARDRSVTHDEVVHAVRERDRMDERCSRSRCRDISDDNDKDEARACFKRRESWSLTGAARRDRTTSRSRLAT